MGVSPMGCRRCPQLACNPLAGPADPCPHTPPPSPRKPYSAYGHTLKGRVHRADPGGLSAEEVGGFDFEGEVANDLP
jgi:hypothetical protein